MQGVGLALAPIALYFSGLLRLLWDGVVAVGSWASADHLLPGGLVRPALLGLCVVLWVVGGIVARRSPGAQEVQVRAPRPARRPALPAKEQAGRKTASRRQPAPIDDDMAEIEALLKSRGIELESPVARCVPQLLHRLLGEARRLRPGYPSAAASRHRDRR